MIQQIRQFLSAPTFADDEDKARIASLLNSILLITIAMMVAVIVALLVTDPTPAILITNLVVLAVPLSLEFVMRRGHVKEAATLFVVTIWLLVSIIAYFGGGLSSSIISSYFLLIVLAGVLSGPRMVVVTTVITLLMTSYIEMLGRNGFLPEPLTPYNPVTDAIGTTGNLIFMAIIMYVTMKSLNRTMALQRESNKALRQSQATLEDRVVERTRNLELAAEIGRYLVQVRELDVLLAEAVALIRDDFDLYYVQIYLADSRRHSLLLSAGSGAIGRDLVRRGHRLAIGPGSINGVTAAQQRVVVVPDTAVSPLFKPNPYLPETRSEMSIPLLAGDNVIGVLNVQNNMPHSLTEQSVPVYVTLAGQLAIAIENARLFSENRQMQARLEREVRQVVHKGWADYLTVLEHKERIGFAHDGRVLYKIEEAPPAPTYNREILTAPIQVQNEAIGDIEILAEPDQSLPHDAQKLISLVAQQVANQIENLRLLSETERYREEAETAIQRLTQENWESSTAELDVAGYIYDQTQLRPITETDGEASDEKAPAIRRNLMVHGESIGLVEIEDVASLDEETEELLTAVTASLSTHLENLRLTQQMEKSLHEIRQRTEELAVLNEMSQAMTAQMTIDGVVKTVYDHLSQLMDTTEFYLVLYEEEKDEVVFVLNVSGEEMRWHAERRQAGDGITEYIIRHRQPLLMADNVDQHLEEMGVAGYGNPAESWLGAPMVVGERVLGVIGLQSYTTPHLYDERHLNLLTAVANQAAIAIESVRLLEETTAQAQEEKTLRQITTHISMSVDAESILKTAVKEIQRTFGVEAFVYLDDSQLGANHSDNDKQVKTYEQP